MPLHFKISLTIHVFAGVIWIGGVLFMAMVALPSARTLDAPFRQRLLGVIGRKFRTIGWAALVVLVLTGLHMIGVWGATVQNVLDGSFFSAPHTRALGYKLLFILLMLPISAVHDWYLGPNALQLEPGSPEAERLRGQAKWMGMATGVLVVFILICAIFVARPWM